MVDLTSAAAELEKSGERSNRNTDALGSRKVMSCKKCSRAPSSWRSTEGVESEWPGRRAPLPFGAQVPSTSHLISKFRGSKRFGSSPE